MDARSRHNPVATESLTTRTDFLSIFTMIVYARAFPAGIVLCNPLSKSTSPPEFVGSIGRASFRAVIARQSIPLHLPRTGYPQGSAYYTTSRLPSLPRGHGGLLRERQPAGLCKARNRNISQCFGLRSLRFASVAQASEARPAPCLRERPRSQLPARCSYNSCTCAAIPAPAQQPGFDALSDILHQGSIVMPRETLALNMQWKVLPNVS